MSGFKMKPFLRFVTTRFGLLGHYQVLWDLVSSFACLAIAIAVFLFMLLCTASVQSVLLCHVYCLLQILVMPVRRVLLVLQKQEYTNVSWKQYTR
jgi:hypothetical protein